VSDDLLEFVKILGLPIDESSKAFDELKTKGIVYTPAKNLEDFTSLKYPFRIAGMPPRGLLKPSEVSFGPFPVEEKVYQEAKKNLTESDSLQVFLGFIRLAYEKTGAMVSGYRFASSDDPLIHFLGLMEMWDIHNPVICEQFLWITPNIRAKQAVEKMLEKKFPKNDFSWWDVRFDLGDDFNPTTVSDYPEEFSISPVNLTGPWGRYLPTSAWAVLLFLYPEMTKGGIFREFENLRDVFNKIERGIEHIKKPNYDLQASVHDKELLVKELCDYNFLTYPVDSTTLLEFLQQIGFIKVNQSQGQIKYLLAKEVISPKSLLKMKEWTDF
jgi:hypothetical protein